MNAIALLPPQSPGSPDLALLVAAVQALPESLAIVDSGVVLFANPAWEALDEFIPEDLFRTADEVRSHDGSGSGPVREVVHAQREGAQLHLQAARAGFCVRGKKFQVISLRDVSSQKLLEKQLRESERTEAIGRLVSGVAHDFNNLLTGIMLYCDLLIAELEKGSRSRHHAEEMRTAGEYGSKLVQQLLAVARPQAVKSRVFALNEIIASVEELLRRLIGENIVMTTALADDLGPVRMDPAQVQQILLNLVLNARDAMPDGGRIMLTTSNGTDYLPGGWEQKPRLTPSVQLAVSDTGCGMDAETLSHALEPFFTTKKPGQGTGLGLATAAQLAKQEGGTIRVESQLGKGTRVLVVLPRVNDDIASGSKSEKVRGDSI